MLFSIVRGRLQWSFRAIAFSIPLGVIVDSSSVDHEFPVDVRVDFAFKRAQASEIWTSLSLELLFARSFLGREGYWWKV